MMGISLSELNSKLLVEVVMILSVSHLEKVNEKVIAMFEKAEDGFNDSALNFYTLQVAAEKPNPTIFLKACDFLGVKPEDAVHMGDDRRNDLWGARDAGCDAWLWGSDVQPFKEVAKLFEDHSNLLDELKRFMNSILDSQLKEISKATGAQPTALPFDCVIHFIKKTHKS